MTGINVSLPPPLPPFYYLLFSPAFFTLPESLKFYYGNTRLRGHETPADVSISFDSVLGEVKLIGCVTPLSYFQARNGGRGRNRCVFGAGTVHLHRLVLLNDIQLMNPLAQIGGSKCSCPDLS